MAVKKVPEYIKSKMYRIVILQRQAKTLMNEIESWLVKNGIDTSIDGLRDGCGTSLEELEYGNDCVEGLCERIENFDTWIPKGV